MRPLTFEPLDAYLARLNDSTNEQPTNVGAATQLGINRSRLSRLRRRGLTWVEADELAVRHLGVHPACIWPDWFDPTAFAPKEHTS